MAIKDHITRIAKLRVKVHTVDPSQRLVEVVTVDGSARQLFITDIRPGFVWPVEGEEWSIYEENGYWILGNKFPNPVEAAELEALQPGETWKPDFKVVGNTSPAIGKILVADASGNATWSSLTESWANLHSYASSIAAGTVAGTYLLSSVGAAVTITSAAIAVGTGIIHLDPTTNYAITGYTPKVRIVGTISNYGAAQVGVNYTFGLYPITAISTTGVPTVGAVVASSTALISAPGNGSINTAYSTSINMPTTGYYCVGVVTNATVAASSTVGLRVLLQRNIA